MRISSSVFALTLASYVAAMPFVRRYGWDDVAHGGYPSPVYHPAQHYPGFPGGGFPGGPGGGFPGGPGGGNPPGNGGNGGNPPGNGGNGGNPPGNGGNGGNPPGNGGNGGNPPGNGGNGGNPPGNGGNGGNPPGNGGNGGNPPGNGGNGGNPPGNGGNGGNPPGNGGNGGTPPGNGGSGGKNVCGVTPNQISALTPLLNKLGLSTTVDGVKQLVDKLLDSTGGLLESAGVNGKGGLIDLVNNLVKGLLGQPLDLHNTVDAVTEILEKQVPCLLDTLLPKP